MSTKIKFSFIKMFFRLFSFLADKTGGWKIFVQPKIMLGTMILGFGVAACNSTGKQKTTCYDVAETQDTVLTTDTISIDTECYKAVIDTLNVPSIKKTTVQCYTTIIIEEYTEENVAIIEDTIQNNDTTIYEIVDKKPEFPSGYKELYKFINDNLNLNFPNVMCYAGETSTKIYCRFVIEKSGEITNIEIVKSAGKVFDDAVIEMIKKMPNWQPAEKDNKPVRARFTLPVYILLKN